MRENLCMMFSGGTDTTLAANRLLRDGDCDRLHLLTFCNGVCVRVDRSRIHVEELKRIYGSERVVHEIIYVTGLFHSIRSPLGELIWNYRSTLVYDLCCRLSMETAAIIYALEHGIPAICDGTNIDQGRLFLERPDYLRVSREYFASFGIRYFSPVYSRSGGRMGRREELLKNGFSVGPKFLEWFDITTCLFMQPFCLMGIHTYFFTSFLRNLPLFRRFIARHTLQLDRAIELRTDRQKVARRLVGERLEHRDPGDSGSVSGIGQSLCTTRMCGQKGVEITFPTGTVIDIDSLRGLRRPSGEANRNDGYLKLKEGGMEILLFPDGRALVYGTRNPGKAMSLLHRLVPSEHVLSRESTDRQGSEQRR